jgi:hypothetical protein
MEVQRGCQAGLFVPFVVIEAWATAQLYPQDQELSLGCRGLRSRRVRSVSVFA